MLRSSGQIIFLSLVSLLVFGCGVDSSFETANLKPAPSQSEMFTIPIRVGVSVASQGLGLISATAFSINLVGCASGYSTTVTAANSSLSVVRGDRNCLAELTSFSANGFTYVPSTPAFTTWQAGNSAIFQATTSSTNRLYVTIVSTLSNPTAASDKVSYAFADISGGNSKSVLGTNVGASHIVLSSGATNISEFLNIIEVQLAGISTTTNAGQFIYTMECATLMSGSTCETVDLTSTTIPISYMLAPASSFTSTLTLAQLNTLYSEGSPVTITASNLVAPGTNGNTNGGFFTQTLTGPNNMETSPFMYFIIHGSYNGTSGYEYINLQVLVSD